MKQDGVQRRHKGGDGQDGLHPLGDGVDTQNIHSVVVAVKVGLGVVPAAGLLLRQILGEVVQIAVFQPVQRRRLHIDGVHCPGEDTRAVPLPLFRHGAQQTLAGLALELDHLRDVIQAARLPVLGEAVGFPGLTDTLDLTIKQLQIMGGTGQGLELFYGQIERI